MNLAINGGEKVGLLSVPVWPRYNEMTKEAVCSVFDSARWAISGQWKGGLSACEIFESEYAAFNKSTYCVAVDHGTNSLVAALHALGIGAGDEVIVPALTWVACAICVCSVNAVPVIVDIDPATFCISPEEIEKHITSKTKAIMPVHLYGCMADMDEIMKIAEKYNLYVIEDASHSHGAMWKDKYAGTIGDIGCFSFQQGKALTSGEGGAAITDDISFYNKLQEIRTNSRMYKLQSDCQMDHMHLQETGHILGTNYCISEFQAAILSEQLQHLEEWNRKKEANARYLDREIAAIPGVTAMYHTENVTKRTYYRYCFKVDNRYFDNKPVKRIAEALEAELGFVVEQPYPPMHQSILYRPDTLKSLNWSSDYSNRINTNNFSTPVAENASYNSGIIFHHSLLLNEREDMDRIVRAIDKVRTFSKEL